MYARMLFYFMMRKSAQRPTRGGSIDVLCPSLSLSLTPTPLPRSDAISFSEFFIFLQELFFLLCLIIWLLDVQHRLGRAHISQHDDWVTHNLFSFSIVWRCVPGRAMAQAGFVYVFWISMILLSLILSHLSIVLLSIYRKVLRRGAGECSFYFISFCSVLWAPVGGWWMDVGGKMVPRSDKSMLHASERKWLGTHRSQLLDRFGSAPLTNLM